MMVTTGARLLQILVFLGLISTSCIASSSKLTVSVEAPNSRAMSVASLESSVWLMVAKMLRSTSFLITRLALTSSFSESSLTVMPSEMVISRLMGGGPESTCRRPVGRRIFSSSVRSRGCGRAVPRVPAGRRC